MAYLYLSPLHGLNIEAVNVVDISIVTTTKNYEFVIIHYCCSVTPTSTGEILFGLNFGANNWRVLRISHKIFHFKNIEVI